MVIKFIVLLVVLVLGLCLMIDVISASEIVNMKKIKMIESTNNPNAFNLRTNAIGLYQITPVVVADYNDHFKTKLKIHELYDPELNEAVAYWYMNSRIPTFLKYYHIKDTVENRLIAWHDGIGNLRKYLKKERTLGKEMQGFLRKYRR